MAKKLVRGLKSKWTGADKYNDSIAFLHETPNADKLGSHIVQNKVDFASVAALENLLAHTVTAAESENSESPYKGMGEGTIVLSTVVDEKASSSKILLLAKLDATTGLYKYTLYHLELTVATTDDRTDAESKTKAVDVSNNEITNSADILTNVLSTVSSISIDDTGHVTAVTYKNVTATDEHVTTVTKHYDPNTIGEGKTLAFAPTTHYTVGTASDATTNYTGEGENKVEKDYILALVGIEMDGAGHVLSTQTDKTHQVVTKSGLENYVTKFATSAMHFIGAGDIDALNVWLNDSENVAREGDVFVYTGATTTLSEADITAGAKTNLEKGDTLICQTTSGTTALPGGKTVAGTWSVVNANWEVIQNTTNLEWNTVYGTGTDPLYVKDAEGNYSPATPANFVAGVTYAKKSGDNYVDEGTVGAEGKLAPSALGLISDTTSLNAGKVGGIDLATTITTPVTSVNGKAGDIVSTYSTDAAVAANADKAKIGTLTIAGKDHDIYALSATYDGKSGNPVKVTNEGATHTVEHVNNSTTVSIPNGLDADGVALDSAKTQVWLATKTTTEGVDSFSLTAPDAVTGLAATTATGKQLVITDATFDGFGHVATVTKDYVTDEKVTAKATNNAFTLLGQTTEANAESNEKAITNNDYARFNSNVKVTVNAIDETISGASKTANTANGTTTYSYVGQFLADSRGTVMSVNATDIDWEEL